MTISRMSPFLCALAVGAVCCTVRADDNAAQAAARVALAKELFDTNAQPATNAPAAVAPAPAESDKEAKAKAKAKAKADKAAAKAKWEADQAAAQQAAQVKSVPAQANVQPKPESKVIVVEQPKMSQPAPAPVPAPVPQPMAEPTPVSGDNPAQAAARMALARQLFDVNSQPTTTQQNVPPRTTMERNVQPAPTAPMTAPAPAPVYVPGPAQTPDNNYVGKELGLKPIAPPPMPINQSKSARLQALLERYKADQITPEEYHQQRAAILSEP